MYAGANWSDAGGRSYDGLVVPFELRTIAPGNFEVILDTSLFAQEARLDHSDIGDTTLRIAQSFRPSKVADYVSFEAGKTVSRASGALRGPFDWNVTARAQGGATQFGYNVSVSFLDLYEDSGIGKDAMSYSTGYRGQFGRLH